jgi:hypothetical protein
MSKKLSNALLTTSHLAAGHVIEETSHKAESSAINSCHQYFSSTNFLVTRDGSFPRIESSVSIIGFSSFSLIVLLNCHKSFCCENISLSELDNLHNVLVTLCLVSGVSAFVISHDFLFIFHLIFSISTGSVASGILRSQFH